MAVNFLKKSKTETEKAAEGQEEKQEENKRKLNEN